MIHMAVVVKDVRMGDGSVRDVHSFFMPRKGRYTLLMMPSFHTEYQPQGQVAHRTLSTKRKRPVGNVEELSPQNTTFIMGLLMGPHPGITN